MSAKRRAVWIASIVTLIGWAFVLLFGVYTVLRDIARSTDAQSALVIPFLCCYGVVLAGSGLVFGLVFVIPVSTFFARRGYPGVVVMLPQVLTTVVAGIVMVFVIVLVGNDGAIPDVSSMIDAMRDLFPVYGGWFGVITAVMLWYVLRPPKVGKDVCAKCGYDLRGLDGAKVCPECGGPVVGVGEGTRVVVGDDAGV